MTYWEYRIDPWRLSDDYGQSERLLGQLGAEGWELVAVLPGTGMYYAQMFLKRRVLEKNRVTYSGI